MAACNRKESAMSSLDKIIAENMVCATINAVHDAASPTIRAFLAAHQQDRSLTFHISIPSTDAEGCYARMLGSAGVTLSRTSIGRFIGTATCGNWTKLLIDHGELLERQSIALCPVRPGCS